MAHNVKARYLHSEYRNKHKAANLLKLYIQEDVKFEIAKPCTVYGRIGMACSCSQQSREFYVKKLIMFLSSQFTTQWMGVIPKMRPRFQDIFCRTYAIASFS